ncbi:Cullin-3 [Cichlidogyrus casuarinus]|uniref:Cullin-3 n=1 Tax=Cichlidogyrus casuarinus TaxID=1844966 RepID=A0ABD2PML4_9PLAT
MFKDVTLSKHLDAEFNKFKGKKECPLDINVRVLTAGLWPTEKESHSIQLPDEALTAFEVFKKFYLKKYSGRKISLQCNQGTAELSAQFYGKSAMQEPEKSLSAPGGPGGPNEEQGSSTGATSSGKKTKTYSLQVSTYQMVLLMKFNKRNQYTFAELLAETSINEKELQRSLMALALGKSSQRILIKEPKSKRIEPNDVFFVNDAFTSEHFKVKVQNISIKDTEPERHDTRQQIDDNRRYVIEATIVRIMKTRKQLEHNLLLTEVMEQLQSRFRPTPQSIKSRIETLLERGYLMRSEEDRRIYKYLT